MNRALQPLAILLAVFAMLVRAALPLGWMPSTDARAPLIICPMMGGMHATPGKHGAPRHHEGSCPFTASLAQLSAAASPPFLSLPPEISATGDFAAVAPFVLARSWRSQSSRGPPPRV